MTSTREDEKALTETLVLLGAAGAVVSVLAVVVADFVTSGDAVPSMPSAATANL
jgi:hypothetical protein